MELRDQTSEKEKVILIRVKFKEAIIDKQN